mmetsp:Transcript_37058/g.115354  ORF Transcript_37058/g.115354 Transcript_37058/m.115354 type:complete len:1011 (-) Transcript_37058:106-3138(-)
MLLVGTGVGHARVEALVPAALVQDLESLDACGAHCHEVLVAIAGPEHLLVPREVVPGAHDAVPRPLHQQDLLVGQLLAPQEAVADCLVVQALLERAVELDEEDVPGLSTQSPGEALPLAVRAAGCTPLPGDHHRGMEDLSPVLVPHDLELGRSAEDADLLGVVAGQVALLHLLEAPGVHGAREVVPALDRRVGGQGLEGQRGARLLRPADPLPADRAPLAGDAQRHKVAVPQAYGTVHHALHLPLSHHLQGRCRGALRAGGLRRRLVVLQHRQPHSAVDQPVRALGAAVGALHRRAARPGGAARVQREVGVPVIVDLELLEAIHPEGHREGPVASRLPRHPLRLVEGGPGADDVVAVGGLGEVLAAAAGPEDHGLVGVAGLRGRHAVRVHAAAADAAAHGAAPADGHDRVQRALRGVRDAVRVDEHVALHEVVDLRIDGRQVDAGLLPAVRLAVERLQHGGQGAALDAVPVVRLEAGEPQRDPRLAAAHLPEGGHLDCVVHQLPVGVALHGVQAARGDMALAARLRHQELHGRTVRRAEVRLHARVVDLDGAYGAKVVAAVVNDGDPLHLLREVVDGKCYATFALHPACGRLVEGQGAAQGADLAQAHAVDPRQRRERHRDAHAHGHGGVRLPLVQRHAAGLQGREAAGGVRVELHAGTVHAEDEGEAVGHDRPGLSGTCRALLTASGLLGALVHHGPFGQVAADVDGGERLQEVLDSAPGGRQRDVADFHDLALHGVHALRLRGGDAEELRVEQVHAVAQGHVVRVHLEVLPAVRIVAVVLAMVPPSVRHLRDDVCRRVHGEEKSLRVPGGGVLDADSPHRVLLLLVVDMLHGILPSAVEILKGVRVLDRRLQLPHRPVVQRLRYRNPRRLAGDALAGGAAAVLQEGREDVGAGAGDAVLVPEHVRAQGHEHACFRLHAVHVALLVEGGHLQGALPGAEAEDEHDAVPDEGVQPLDDVVLRHLRRVPGEEAGLVHEARRAAAHGDAELLHRGGGADHGRHARERGVELP